MKIKALLIFTLFFSIGTIAIYISSSISPEKCWPAGFIAFLIPVVIVINLLIFIILLFIRPVFALIPLFTLILGYRFIKCAYPLNFFDKPPTANTLKVVSYNVRVFNSYKHLRSDKNYMSSKKILKFILDSHADIVCLQEFYNDKGSNVFNTIEKLSAVYPYYYVSGDLKNIYGNQFGLAIFSKYKISGKGFISFSKKTKNKVLYTDLNIKNRNIRIYNVHLQSMHIEENKIVDNEWNREAKKNIFNELKKVKRGMIDRALQLRLIEQNMNTCDRTIILCGDLNDTPFSYTYQKLKDRFSNAHEKAGYGWGTTYNGKLPLLRIDNQFADKRLKITESKTYNQIPYSDHFPIMATYSWE